MRPVIRTSFTFIQITDLHVGFSGFGGDEPLEIDLRRFLRDGAQVRASSRLRAIFRTTGRFPSFSLAARRWTRSRSRPSRFLETTTISRRTRLRRTARVGPTSYSFDWGPVHFVAYDSISDRPDAAGRAWLAGDLAAQPPGKTVAPLVHYQLADDFFSQWRKYAIVASISGIGTRPASGTTAG